MPEAIGETEKAIALRSDYGAAHFTLGNLWRAAGRLRQGGGGPGEGGRAAAPGRRRPGQPGRRLPAAEAHRRRHPPAGGGPGAEARRLRDPGLAGRSPTGRRATCPRRSPTCRRPPSCGPTTPSPGTTWAWPSRAPRTRKGPSPRSRRPWSSSRTTPTTTSAWPPSTAASARPSEAIAAYEAALEHNPKLAGAHYDLGVLYCPGQAPGGGPGRLPQLPASTRGNADAASRKDAEERVKSLEDRRSPRKGKK